MEFFMLETLNFALCRPTPLDFLDYYVNFFENNVKLNYRFMNPLLSNVFDLK